MIPTVVVTQPGFQVLGGRSGLQILPADSDILSEEMQVSVRHNCLRKQQASMYPAIQAADRLGQPPRILASMPILRFNNVATAFLPYTQWSAHLDSAV